MKKIHETDYYSSGDSGSAERLIIYTVDNDDEYWALSEFTYGDWEDETGYYNEYGVPAGALFHEYHFKLFGSYVIVKERIAYNV